MPAGYRAQRAPEPQHEPDEEPAPPAPEAVAKPKKSKQTHGHIALDIYEEDGCTIIRAPIAGVRLSDLDIEIDEKVVTIRGSRRAADIEDEHYYLRECFWGEFSRSVTLPFVVDPKKVKATFSKDCVLKITIPREEKVKIVRINEGG